ncbi:monovalent cation/H+ antiporter subunit A [Thiofilum flexile]|uniref:monovalent cation/H+ antiporter subunit A n=1 Tax=Thiofilum flexile TaxID=125627 RepID=UPI000362AD51|nr:monovalent cation/H+ antiporter subunit A [Thiofilum flexile]
MTLVDFNLPVVVLLPFLGALLATQAARFNRLAAAGTAAVITILALILLLPALPLPFAGQTLIQRWEWVPSLGLEFAFRLDGLGLLFALLILVIGLLVIIYARYYLSPQDSMGRFFAFLLSFMGSMLGIVLSENLIQLVIFWELTSLSSFLLISYWYTRSDARQGARMALTITGMGGLALFGGVLILGHIVGSFNLTEVLAASSLIHASPWYTPMLVLILLGAFTKSAQFPFHFWLPHAMAAPTPVSAYLHSATMVKAGIFLLVRLFPVLSGTPEWHWLVGTAGMLTLLLGAFTALFKHDIKGLLAYSTISHLGLITLLLGIGSPLAVVAALFHIINHATFKASLFMVAGIVDHETGTRDMRRVNGLMKYMPQVGILAIIASAAMAGVPLLNGFLSKEMFFDQTVSVSAISPLAWVIPVLATLAGVFSVAYSARFVHDIFFNGEPINLPKKPHEPPLYMKIPVGLLVLACIAVGVFPVYTIAGVLYVAIAGALQTTPPEYSLALWHGFSAPLLMSFIALVVGLIVYLIRKPLFAWYDRGLSQWDARIVYQALVNGLIHWAQSVTRRLDRGTFRNMLIWFFGVTLLAGVVGFWDEALLGTRELMPVDGITAMAIAGLILSSLLTVLKHRSRLISLVMLGVVGLVVSLGFAKFSAPDLALTQLSVEIVTVVLLMLALYFLPQYTHMLSSHKRHYQDIAWAMGLGFSAALLTLAVLTRDLQSISGYFLAHSKTGGGGTNVVNVILVDFRGFDTLGEIVVLALAGLGIVALLQGIKLYAPKRNAEGVPWSQESHPLILQVQARILFPMMLMVAIFIFLRGHNLPGGGFIAGLIAALAIVLQNLANGIVWTAARIRWDMHSVLAAGIGIATFTGLGAMLMHYPFLTSTFTYLKWPIVGKFEIASAMGFDTGVFLVVVGATVMILVQLGRLNYIETEDTGDLQPAKGSTP